MGFAFQVLEQQDVPLQITQVLLLMNDVSKFDDEVHPLVRSTIEFWKFHFWQMLLYHPTHHGIGVQSIPTC